MTTLLAALSLGFLGSFHCIGMCGPIALALPIGGRSGFLKVVLILFYNAGRILTYSIFGLLFGIIGKGFFMAGYQQALSITIGVILLIGIILPPNYLARYKLNAKVFSFFNYIKQSLGKLFLKEKSGSLFLIGVLNGLLPCGLVYMAVAGAIASGDPFSGALFMAFFGLGTLPMMFAIPFVGQYVGTSVKSKIRKVIPVLVGMVAVVLILRGLNLGIPYISPKIDKTTNTVAACHSPEHACCHKK